MGVRMINGKEIVTGEYFVGYLDKSGEGYVETYETYELATEKAKIEPNVSEWAIFKCLAQSSD